MEDRALELLRTMLERRKLDTKTERVVTEALDRANIYTIGNVLVVFSQKDKGLQDRDITKILDFANANQYTNGVIIVAMSPASDNVLKTVKGYAKDRVQFFHIRQLQFDITAHRMVMPHYIFNEEFRSKYPVIAEEYDRKNIEKPEDQLPWIDSQDPPIKWIGALPGDVIVVIRHSDVAGEHFYFRYCVPDVNVA